VVVPASTGGLLVAVALAVKQLSPQTRVIGVQPQGANAMVRSFRSRSLCRLDQVVTECDALTANLPGPLPWELCQTWVDDMVEVSEQAVRQSVRWLVEEAKLVVEPGGAAGLAALQSGQIQDAQAWAVLSGGNMEPRRLAQWL
jgi:threonine dehydratase